jgi:hypothetical protein
MRPAKAEQRVVRRAQALLMMADGVPGTDIARVLGVHVPHGTRMAASLRVRGAVR